MTGQVRVETVAKPKSKFRTIGGAIVVKNCSFGHIVPNLEQCGLARLLSWFLAYFSVSFMDFRP